MGHRSADFHKLAAKTTTIPMQNTIRNPFHARSRKILVAILGFALAGGLVLAGTDDLILPGQSFGPLAIVPGLTRANVLEAFGEEAVRFEKRPGPEGGPEVTVAVVRPGTEHEALVEFGPGGEVTQITVSGGAWQFPNGLKVGMRLADLEKLNGKPVGFLGFAWDNAGFVTDLSDGNLPADIGPAVMIWLEFDGKPPAALIGDSQLRSDTIGKSKDRIRVRQLRVVLDTTSR